MAPARVKRGKIERQLLHRVYSRIKQVGPGKFQVGDLVRISKYKNLFAKGYKGNWTTEIFRIAKRQLTNPVTYLLQDLLEVYVKWLGFDSRHNSWINKKSVL